MPYLLPYLEKIFGAVCIVSDGVGYTGITERKKLRNGLNPNCTTQIFFFIFLPRLYAIFDDFSKFRKEPHRRVIGALHFRKIIKNWGKTKKILVQSEFNLFLGLILGTRKIKFLKPYVSTHPVEWQNWVKNVVFSPYF